MRPRLDAGEYAGEAGWGDQGRRGFNEAPAGCRGIRRGAIHEAGRVPGFNEAPAGCRGIHRARGDIARDSASFNEAPAGCRGILINSAMMSARWLCFNEAPAGCRGIPGRRPPHPRGAPMASMRPRLDAGEYIPSRWGGPTPPRSFNEAPAGCRGIRALARRQRLYSVASMRPRLDAGEYEPDNSTYGPGHRASMRPRLDAGEYFQSAHFGGADTGLQ